MIYPSRSMARAGLVGWEVQRAGAGLQLVREKAEDLTLNSF